MTFEQAEAMWLDEREVISIDEIVERSGFSEAELRDFVEYGVIAPVDRQAARWTFCPDCIVTLRAAYRLRDDFDLGAHQLALVLSLMGQVRDLEARLQNLAARMPQEEK